MTDAENKATGVEAEHAALATVARPLDYDDPHRAALEDNPERAEKLSWSVILSVLFLGLSFTGKETHQ
jgi:hypothetical protein